METFRRIPRRRAGGPAFLGAVLVMLFCGFRQQTPLVEIREALRRGDAQALLAVAAERVEIALLGRSTLYSRSQATYVLQDFFRHYPPKRFVLINDSRAGGSWFAVGRYEVQGGDQPLDVYLRLRARGGGWELREVRIEQRRR
jgi:hypothetical protein